MANSGSSGDVWTAAATGCPSGTIFSVPTEPRSNALLLAALRATSYAGVWIDYSDGTVDDCWVSTTYRCPYRRVRRKACRAG